MFCKKKVDRVSVFHCLYCGSIIKYDNLVDTYVYYYDIRKCFTAQIQHILYRAGNIGLFVAACVARTVREAVR